MNRGSSLDVDSFEMPLLVALVSLLGPQIDAKAMATLVRSETKMAQTQSLQETWVCIRQSKAVTHREVWKVRLLRPNLARTDLWFVEAGVRKPVLQWSLVADGTKTTKAYHSAKTFDQQATSNGDATIKLLAPLSGFFQHPNSMTERIKGLSDERLVDGLQLDRSETVGGVRCDVVSLTRREPGVQRQWTERTWIDSAGLIRKQMATSGDRTITYELLSVRVDDPIRPQSFAYQPPKGYQPSQPDGPQEYSANERGKLIDFAVQDLAGQPVRVSDYLGKVVVLDFWATWCGNCLAGFPEMNRLAGSRDGQVVVLGVDIGDRPEVFSRWLDKNKQYGSIRFVLDPKAIDGLGEVGKVQPGIGLPTAIVLSKEGRIVAKVSGYSGKRTHDLIDQAVRSALE